MASLIAIPHPILAIFIGDHRQTPGGLSKSRQATKHRKKLLRRHLGLRGLNQPGDYVAPTSLRQVLRKFLALEQLIDQSGDEHQGPWWADGSQRDVPLLCTRVLPAYFQCRQRTYWRCAGLARIGQIPRGIPNTTSCGHGGSIRPRRLTQVHGGSSSPTAHECRFSSTRH